MIIIGCDFHTRYQQIAMADDETGELLLDRRLDHESGKAQAFYRNFSMPHTPPLRVGVLNLSRGERNLSLTIAANRG
jgi:hypothetical protein